MIVGEAEVQGQVRRAYEAALEAGTTGPMTNRLFGAALQTGKRVRSETGIAPRARRASRRVAVDLARDVVGDLESRRVVIIGAGETTELTAQALADQGVRTIFVANRHADRARSLAERFGGEVGSLDELPDAPRRRPTSSSPRPRRRTRSSAPTSSRAVMRARDGRPLVLIDIAVPRDIEPACGELDGVHALRHRRPAGRRRAQPERARGRARAAPRRSSRRRSSASPRWMAQLDVHADDRRAARARRRDRRAGPGRERRPLGDASPRDLARIEAIARAVMQRLLHEPTIRLKATSGGHGRQQLLRELFGLDEGRRAPRRRRPTAPEAPTADNVRPLKRRA